MTDLEFLKRRIQTLTALLGAPGGAVQSRDGEVLATLRANWETERRLLERIVEESRDRPPREVVAAWRQRTERFLACASDPDPSWQDRAGRTWWARPVLSALIDLEERLAVWAESSETAGAEED